jgi:hypothetical protein
MHILASVQAAPRIWIGKLCAYEDFGAHNKEASLSPSQQLHPPSIKLNEASSVTSSGVFHPCASEKPSR